MLNYFFIIWVWKMFGYLSNSFKEKYYEEIRSNHLE